MKTSFGKYQAWSTNFLRVVGYPKLSTFTSITKAFINFWTPSLQFFFYRLSTLFWGLTAWWPLIENEAPILYETYPKNRLWRKLKVYDWSLVPYMNALVIDENVDNFGYLLSLLYRLHIICAEFVVHVSSV